MDNESDALDSEHDERPRVSGARKPPHEQKQSVHRTVDGDALVEPEPGIHFSSRYLHQFSIAFHFHSRSHGKA